jgi:hypothetical protein
MDMLIMINQSKTMAGVTCGMHTTWDWANPIKSLNGTLDDIPGYVGPSECAEMYSCEDDGCTGGHTGPSGEVIECPWHHTSIDHPTNLETAQQSLINLISESRPTDRISILSYGAGGFKHPSGYWSGLDWCMSEEAEDVYSDLDQCLCGGMTHIYEPFTYDKEQLKWRVDQMLPRNSMSVLEFALSAPKDIFGGHGADPRPQHSTERVLVIITDGSESQMVYTSLFLPWLNDLGVEIFIIAVGDIIGDGIPYNVVVPEGMTGTYPSDYPGSPIWAAENAAGEEHINFGDGDPDTWNTCAGIIEENDIDYLDQTPCVMHCPFPSWHGHNCTGFWLKTLASSPEHYFRIEGNNTTEIQQALFTIHSQYCDSGYRCCKNLNKAMCDGMGGDWKEGYCQNEGELCKNFGTRSCGTSPDCGAEQYVGACCISGNIDSICQGSMTQQSCLDLGGDFKGVGSICSDHDCGADVGGYVGACCRDGGCDNEDRALWCIQNDGIWYGDMDCGDVTCCDANNSDSGACCRWNSLTSEPICEWLPECTCATLGGQFAGKDVQCDGADCYNVYVGACCDGAECSISSFADCDPDNTNPLVVWNGSPTCVDVCCEDNIEGICCLNEICYTKTKCRCNDVGGIWSEGECDAWSCTTQLDGNSVLTYVMLPSGRCDWVMCIPGSCPYPECNQ